MRVDISDVEHDAPVRTPTSSGDVNAPADSCNQKRLVPARTSP
jgi:hypothetical protein